MRDAAGEVEGRRWWRWEERRGEGRCVRERIAEVVVGGGLVLLESCRSAAREEGYGLDVPDKAHAGKI